MNFMMIKNESKFMNVKDWQITYNYKEIQKRTSKYCHEMNKIMKQYNASLESANVIQLRSLSFYDTSKADTQKIAKMLL